VTFYRTAEELPAFTDYAMKDRTYKYMQGDALYPFGFGLSYTKFKYTNLIIKAMEGGEASAARNRALYHVTANVRNEGKRAGWETAELYLASNAPGQPRWQLRGLCPVCLEAGESKEVSFDLLEKHLWVVLDNGSRKILPGTYTVYVSGSQPDRRSVELGGKRHCL